MVYQRCTRSGSASGSFFTIQEEAIRPRRLQYWKKIDHRHDWHAASAGGSMREQAPSIPSGKTAAGGAIQVKVKCKR